METVKFRRVCASCLWSHQQRVGISSLLSFGESGAAGCCWSALLVSGDQGSAVQTAAAHPGSTSWTGTEQRNPPCWTLLLAVAESYCLSSERCRQPAEVASMRRSRCPGGQEAWECWFTHSFSSISLKDWNSVFTGKYIMVPLVMCDKVAGN